MLSHIIQRLWLGELLPHQLPDIWTGKSRGDSLSHFIGYFTRPLGKIPVYHSTIRHDQNS